MPDLELKRSYAIRENKMTIIKDTNTLLHNFIDSELKEKDKEIERLNNIIKKLEDALISHRDIKQKCHYGCYYVDVEEVYSYIQELKDSDKE